MANDEGTAVVSLDEMLAQTEARIVDDVTALVERRVAEARRLALMEAAEIADEWANTAIMAGDSWIADKIASSLRSAAEMPKTDSATGG